MRPDKEEAIKLRLQGKSYLEIQQTLGVPKSTLSGWLANLVINSELRKQIMARAHTKSLAGLLKRNVNQTLEARKRMVAAMSSAATEIKQLSKRDLLILGTALYWAEGYKRLKVRNGKEVTHHPISLTNSDPMLVKVFIKFLTEVYEIPLEKIKANLRIFKHLNENEMKKFWQGVTGIPHNNFKKTYLGISKSSLGKRPFNRLPYGVIQIVVANTQQFHRLIGHIEGIKSLV